MPDIDLKIRNAIYFCNEFLFCCKLSRVSMLNVHEVLWFAPTTPTSQINKINDYNANMVMITNRR